MRFITFFGILLIVSFAFYASLPILMPKSSEQQNSLPRIQIVPLACFYGKSHDGNYWVTISQDMTSQDILKIIKQTCQE